jgi:hypothetical protein
MSADAPERAEAESMYRRWRRQLALIDIRISELNEQREGARMLLVGLERLYPGIEHAVENATTGTETEPKSELEPGSEPVTEPRTRHAPSPGGWVEVVDMPSSILAALEMWAKSSQPDAWVSTGDLVQLLEARGWLRNAKDPESAVRNALRRLIERGVVRREAVDGRSYRYAPAFDGNLFVSSTS